MAVALMVGIGGSTALFAAVGLSPLSGFLAVAWAFMTTFIVAAVDESIRN